MSSDQLDTITRLTVALLLGVWLFLIGMKYQAEYMRPLIELTGQPWWRLLIVIGVIAAAFWCPMVGALAALATVLYLADTRALTVYQM